VWGDEVPPLTLEERTPLTDTSAVPQESQTEPQLRPGLEPGTQPALNPIQPNPNSNPIRLDPVAPNPSSQDPEPSGERVEELEVSPPDLNALKRVGSKLHLVDSSGRKAESRAVRLLALLMLVVGVPLGGWFLFFRSHSEPTNLMEKIVRVTSFPGREDQAVFSPDGNQVAFVWSGKDEDNNDIYVKMTDEDNLLRLTTNPASDMYPAWSPDGRSIAFVRQAPDAAGIYKIPVLGGTEQKVADIFAARPIVLGNMMSYDPDGKSLVISDRKSQDAPLSIYRVIESGEKIQLTTAPAGTVGDLYPVISPDRKTMAFIRFKDISAADLYLLSLTDGELRRLTTDNSYARGLVWVSDGSEIVYSSRRSGSTFNFWKVPVKGGVPERLMVSEHDVFNPAISRQGNRFVYTRSFLDLDILRLGLNDTTLRNEPPQILAPSTQDDDSPNYSPDGKKIVFASRRTGNFEIWICDSDGTNQRQLTNMGGPLTGSPRWSPDGREVVFDSWAGGNADIYVINVNDGKPRRMTNHEAEDITASWSRDGRWIYFCSTRSGTMQTWKLPAGGGDPVQVTQNGGFEGFESTDGKYLYYAKGRSIPGIWRVPVGGGEETLVLDHHQAGVWRYWTVTDKGIYFATAEVASRPLLEFFNFATKKVTQIATLNKPLARTLPGLSLSPDGRSILVVQIEQSNLDIIMMENFH
ncbi:MAG TPA: hypothetical protein VJ302_35280, partial [Blastocatellia bacterium]|nr:hypothetical protein [Blastocatellia bacterium]